MITKIIVRNFKKFDNVEIELGNPVVFVGPNNSGKTSALQAIALWNIGVTRWLEKRKNSKSKKRTAVALNRLDILTIPVPSVELFWRNLHLRKKPAKERKTATENIYIDIIVKGITKGTEWESALEFNYQNSDVLYCRPKSISENSIRDLNLAAENKIAYLPPMSGLTSIELRLDQGAINVRIGEGRTAEVLRNLCYKILFPEINSDNHTKKIWDRLVEKIENMFGVTINRPEYIPERGEIKMTYQEKSLEGSKRFDISSAGKGLQQVLLLLAYLYANKNSILLLDEPDAHLEILRQREIYTTLSTVAEEQHNQLVIATHSEILLEEAEKDLVVAFVGRPHIMQFASQVRKSLKEISFHDYYQAEQTGWVLYLEGSTDLSILQAFAKQLNNNKAIETLRRPFVKYIGNVPSKARAHYRGLKEAYSDLKAIAIYDRIENQQLQQDNNYIELMWERCEIENYFAFPEVLLKYCVGDYSLDLFTSAESENREKNMEECIRQIVPPIAIENRNDTWWIKTKLSDDFLERIFELYFKKLGLINTFRKSNYHQLVTSLEPNEILPEVIDKLNSIIDIAWKVEIPK